MKITKQWLDKHYACKKGEEFFLAEGIFDHEKGVLNLLAKGHDSWANWLIVRLMTHRQKVQYAVFAAQQVLSLFESRFPNDKRPREAIKAAIAYIEHPSKTTAYAAYAEANAAVDAAYAAANAAANAAADAADAAADAVANAADAAYAAADAAYVAANTAANAADAAANAAAYVAYAAANAAPNARNALQLKMVTYGLKLIRKRRNPSQRG